MGPTLRLLCPCLLLLAAAGCKDAADDTPAKAAPSTNTVDRADGGTGFDFDFDQGDIKPAPDPSERAAARYLPEPLDAGIVELADPPPFQPPLGPGLDGGTPLESLEADTRAELCTQAVVYTGMLAGPYEVGRAHCTYALADAVGFDSAAECEETIDLVNGCGAAPEVRCGIPMGCQAPVATFTDCVRELGAERAGWVALFGDCTVFEGAPGDVVPPPALAGRPLACESLEAACPGTLSEH